MLDERCNAWLSTLLARHGAVAGTVHVVRDDALTIVAAVNIPPKVQEVTASIPMGKGMAGLSWRDDRAVQTCNLKDDTSGAVKPGAKAVDARAAVALPVHDGAGRVRAIVGLAWMDERVLADETLAQLARDAEALPLSF